MKVDIINKNIINLQYCIDGRVYVRLYFNGMSEFKMKDNFKDFVFNNKEEAYKYLSENMHDIEINLQKEELKKNATKYKNKIIFDKTKIWFGNKKRFIEISKNKFFCFYDGFGGMEGQTLNLKKTMFFKEYKNASASDVEKSMDSLQEDMKWHKRKIEKLINFNF